MIIAISLLALTSTSAGHGPEAAFDTFPAHVFQLAPRTHERPELTVHFGLSQPILFGGFNAALDLRIGRWLFSYSHGQGLDYSGTFALSRGERDAGLQLRSPWTTGGGVGFILIDELWIMADFKVHKYEANTSGGAIDYTTISVGGEIGWRYFIWRGLNLSVFLRFWPNVHSTLDDDRAALPDDRGGDVVHEAKNLGFFANASLGWAFDL